MNCSTGRILTLGNVSKATLAAFQKIGTPSLMKDGKREMGFLVGSGMCPR